VARRPIRTTLTASVLLGGVLAVPSVGATADDVACPAPAAPMEFVAEYIDTTRAGGEPIIVTHPDGQLLWGSHAGTTHFYTPTANDPDTAAFVANYEGQTYQYVSENGGESWDFVSRTPVGTLDPFSGLPNSGFSDPEFAIDLAGNVFISEINLANIAFSKSTDGGRSYTLQNVAGITLSDRQWMEADEEDVLWFVANTFGGGSPNAGQAVTGSLSHRLYKSTDGGATFGPAQDLGGQQSSDILIDRRDGRLYEIHRQGGDLTMWIAPNARDQAPPNVEWLNRDGSLEKPRSSNPPVIATNHSRQSSIGPTMALGPDDEIYVVWDESGNGRDAGIWFNASTDRGETWGTPVKLDDGTGTAFWPWLAAGPDGVVAVWLQNTTRAPGNSPERATGDWNVMVAQSVNPAGCEVTLEDGSTATAAPTFSVQVGSPEPVHSGTMCNSGTTCQAFAVDRRLGDYFANTIDRDGNVVIAVSDTRRGGAVSLPLAIRQVGGTTVGDPYAGIEALGFTDSGDDVAVIEFVDAAGDTVPSGAATSSCPPVREYVDVLARRAAGGC
jgi:hypothetical protein